MCRWSKSNLLSCILYLVSTPIVVSLWIGRSLSTLFCPLLLLSANDQGRRVVSWRSEQNNKVAIILCQKRYIATVGDSNSGCIHKKPTFWVSVRGWQNTQAGLKTFVASPHTVVLLWIGCSKVWGLNYSCCSRSQFFEFNSQFWERPLSKTYCSTLAPTTHLLHSSNCLIWLVNFPMTPIFVGRNIFQ